MQKLQLKTQLFNTSLDLIVEDSVQTQALLQKISEVANILQASFNIYDSTSEISKLNTDKSIEASAYLIDILTVAKKYENLTDYYFNTNQAFIDQNNIEINGNIVTVNHPVDLGGIAKGYFMMIVKNMLEKYNLDYEMNFGGSILSTKNKTITIRNMQSPKLNCIQLELPKHAAIHTSSYYFQLDGENSHIHSKANGYSKLNKSVSVISSNPILADAFSTALYCMALDIALKYIEKYQLTVIYCLNDDVYISKDLVTSSNLKLLDSDITLYTI